MLAGALVAGLIVLQQAFMGPAVTGLSVGLVVSYAVWLRFYQRIPLVRGRVGLYYALALVTQGLHFLEEVRTGFQRDFPQLWGTSWSDQRFVLFNLAALAVFVVAGAGLLVRARLAFLFVWFMALVGGIANGLLHIFASVARGGYFPGSATAVVHLVVGSLLLRELLTAAPSRPPPGEGTAPPRSPGPS